MDRRIEIRQGTVERCVRRMRGQSGRAHGEEALGARSRASPWVASPAPTPTAATTARATARPPTRSEPVRAGVPTPVATITIPASGPTNDRVRSRCGSAAAEAPRTAAKSKPQPAKNITRPRRERRAGPQSAPARVPAAREPTVTVRLLKTTSVGECRGSWTRDATTAAPDPHTSPASTGRRPADPRPAGASPRWTVSPPAAGPARAAPAPLPRPRPTPRTAPSESGCRTAPM